MRPVLLILTLILLGCGQRGALYLPEEPVGEAVTGQQTEQPSGQASDGTATGSGEDEEENAETGEPDPDESGPGEPGTEPPEADKP